MGEPNHAPWVRKLKGLVSLAEVDEEALMGLSSRIVEFGADEEIIREGDDATECNLLLDGFVYRYKALVDGGRQIVAFHFAGDVFDAQSFLLPRMDHSVSTLTPCRIAAIAHSALARAFEEHPRIGLAVWKETLVDASIYRQWVANLGARDAYARTAHLACEIFVRLTAIGSARGNCIDWPITQAELADALGMSQVHVNRTLRELRKEGIVAIDRQQLTVLNWDRLQAAADFDPRYLHLGEKVSS